MGYAVPKCILPYLWFSHYTLLIIKRFLLNTIFYLLSEWRIRNIGIGKHLVSTHLRFVFDLSASLQSPLWTRSHLKSGLALPEYHFLYWIRHGLKCFFLGGGIFSRKANIDDSILSRIFCVSYLSLPSTCNFARFHRDVKSLLLPTHFTYNFPISF